MAPPSVEAYLILVNHIQLDLGYYFYMSRPFATPMS